VLGGSNVIISNSTIDEIGTQIVLFKDDVYDFPSIKIIWDMLIYKNNTELYRPGLYKNGLFRGFSSQMEIINSNITNSLSKKGLFQVSNFELKIVNSLIERCWGLNYSAIVFSI
jgi:hypothetical protein